MRSDEVLTPEVAREWYLLLQAVATRQVDEKRPPYGEPVDLDPTSSDEGAESSTRPKPIDIHV
jgi:hypothetical protein